MSSVTSCTLSQKPRFRLGILSRIVSSVKKQMHGSGGGGGGGGGVYNKVQKSCDYLPVGMAAANSPSLCVWVPLSLAPTMILVIGGPQEVAPQELGHLSGPNYLSTTPE